MNLNSIKQWLASKGGFSHVVVGAYVALIALYAKAPAVASLLNTIYATLPAWSHEVILAVLGAAAFYSNSDAPTKANADAAADRAASAGNYKAIDGTTHLGLGILLIVGLGLLATPARAQLDPTVTTTADGIHYHGAWSAGNTETALITARASTPDSYGFVNTTSIGGVFHLYSAGPGFNTYAGTVSYEPTSYLASFLHKVTPSISADYVRFSLHGDVGDTVPTVGKSYITGGGGAQFDIALTSDGALVWNTVYAGWQNPGIVIVKSGLQYYFGNTTTTNVQSRKAVKLRRALLGK